MQNSINVVTTEQDLIDSAMKSLKEEEESEKESDSNRYNPL